MTYAAGCLRRAPKHAANTMKHERMLVFSTQSFLPMISDEMTVASPKSKSHSSSFVTPWSHTHTLSLSASKALHYTSNKTTPMVVTNKI